MKTRYWLPLAWLACGAIILAGLYGWHTIMTGMMP